MDVMTMDSIISGLTLSTGDFYAIGGAMLVVGAGMWAFGKLKALVMDAGSVDGAPSVSAKGSSDYYRERNQYRHSKRGSYERWERAVEGSSRRR